MINSVTDARSLKHSPSKVLIALALKKSNGKFNSIPDRRKTLFCSSLMQLDINELYSSSEFFLIKRRIQIQPNVTRIVGQSISRTCASSIPYSRAWDGNCTKCFQH